MVFENLNLYERDMSQTIPTIKPANLSFNILRSLHLRFLHQPSHHNLYPCPPCQHPITHPNPALSYQYTSIHSFRHKSKNNPQIHPLTLPALHSSTLNITLPNATRTPLSPSTQPLNVQACPRFRSQIRIRIRASKPTGKDLGDIWDTWAYQHTLILPLRSLPHPLRSLPHSLLLPAPPLLPRSPDPLIPTIFTIQSLPTS